MNVKVAQSCPTLCDPMDYTVHGILLARILEWVAFPFSRGCSQPRDRTQVSCIAGRFFSSWATRGSPSYTGKKVLTTQQPGKPLGRKFFYRRIPARSWALWVRFLKKCHWSTVDLQCCVHFFCRANRLSSSPHFLQEVGSSPPAGPADPARVRCTSGCLWGICLRSATF